VRECPAKAIRIQQGKAEVLPERCVGCGNCVKVCNMQAKEVLGSIAPVQALLAGADRVCAMVAPSFPAEFTDIEPRTLTGMLRNLGFDCVADVSFGADLVAERYRRLLEENPGGRYIAVNCPALVMYVEKYHPALVPFLAPVVSPMVAAARVMRRLHGDDLKVVFVGPCIAKKAECDDESLEGEIDAVLTFAELRTMFAGSGITPDSAEPGDFDPPHSGLGILFPIASGMLQAADIEEDLAAGEVVNASGRQAFVDALDELDTGGMDLRLLEILCCNGCVMGAGMTTRDQRFRRRSNVSAYARDHLAHMNFSRWHVAMERFRGLDLSRGFTPDDMRMKRPSPGELEPILERLGKSRPEDELNCGACGYSTCRDHAVAIYDGLAETEMCLPATIDQLRSALADLASSHSELESAREALQHAEKMATMGQLAAGIAHEVNNPLGIVLMYSHMLLEDCRAGSPEGEDLRMIAEQADRCRKIVSGLLDFARQNKVLHQLTDLRELASRCLSMVTIPEGVQASVEDRTADPMAEVDPDQMTQVVTNLLSNSIAAMEGGGRLTVILEGDERSVHVSVADTGTGIPVHIRDRIFEPFFTTKSIGRGTGLGLAVTYGIVKMHRGAVAVESNADPAAGPTGTTMRVTVPRYAASGGPGEGPEGASGER
jgi:signal transduction histidine kinase/iron only hydrogenase large subunit-like protein